MKNTRKLVFMALLLSVSLVLHYVEGWIPVPIPAPGVKLGLANIVTMVTIVLFGFKETFILVILRSFTSSILGGAISSFLFSIVGGTLSAIIMYLLYFHNKEYFSLMGISIVGAIFHNIGQLFVASILIFNFSIFTYLPILMLSGIITGYFVGLSAKYILKVLSKHLKFIEKEI
ncbi:Gx transporter family protein [Garciella nitratireducens]|uniref:Heptaprenyl diphosphate synthase n=1 Tax=Garciella nitratireducens DSM 15102 TaxID=1121911 RepID=A0A1T4LGF5_9FIRM|nr:Gx transporter family protein [Garciella nitratireducens]SJZ53677.1 heptaprenyl diphosphate synthase [Garciella nitratireducens DSM 15102]